MHGCACARERGWTNTGTDEELGNHPATITSSSRQVSRPRQFGCLMSVECNFFRVNQAEHPAVASAEDQMRMHISQGLF